MKVRRYKNKFLKQPINISLKNIRIAFLAALQITLHLPSPKIIMRKHGF